MRKHKLGFGALVVLSTTIFSCSQTAAGSNGARTATQPVNVYANSQYNPMLPYPIQLQTANVPDQADQPEYWLNLAATYQQQGRIDDAQQALNEFLQRFPQNNQCGFVNARLDSLKHIGDDHYSRCVMQGMPGHKAQLEASKRWSRTHMPLRVYIADGSNVKGYRDTYRKVVIDSFRQWTQCSVGNIQCTLTSNPQACDIKCLWSDNPQQLTNKTEGGETTLVVDKNGAIQSAQIVLLTELPNSPPVTDQQMTQLALHEIGHALGIGHSSKNTDVMSRTGYGKRMMRLSSGDRLIVAELYSQQDPGP